MSDEKKHKRLAWINGGGWVILVLENQKLPDDMTFTRAPWLDEPEDLHEPEGNDDLPLHLEYAEMAMRLCEGTCSQHFRRFLERKRG